MWPVKNKTIIGLKYIYQCYFIIQSVKNKTIIGLKCHCFARFVLYDVVKNKTIIGLKLLNHLMKMKKRVKNKTIIGLKYIITYDTFLEHEC